ncbi:PAS/PAC sensor hybrid histidine kinase [Oscillatoria nigro-viridis PCC 7112]|uniref:Circadian input-output histidine kinase CikA n=1 Tax=Phormidium nigroviride PCC 7112 TaxID=179408 RepID=K9VJ31_9CYAN|nr:PAS domain S-box protein [Oscillatoria nigro-viridis]AFZ08083.1 PAS/PAC sensor hybrid histidine kinase [Oscillatoria nigro-viridis PCC 7112]
MSKFPPKKTQPPQQESTTAQVLRQAHFDAFFAGANAGMLIFDRQLRYVQINEVLAQMNGVCVADHIGRSVREVLPELAPTVEPMLQGILDTGKPILDYELVGETPKEPGILRYWQASYYPLLDENGIVFGLGGIVIEITDRKRAEQKQARMTAILEATSDLVGVCDAAGHSVYLNKAGQEMLGMSPEEARSPFTIDSVLAPSARAKFHNDIIPTALREGRWAGETLFLSRDGEEIPVSQVLIVHKTAAGEVEFISTIVRDIRDRKKAEEERQLLATTIENSRDFIGVASMDGRPILVNQAGLDLVGLSSLEEAKTKHITDFFMAEDLDFVQQSIMPAIMQDGSWRSDFRFRHFQTGQPILVDYTLFLIKHPETNEPVGIATITRDIRDRKNAEDVLKQSEERFRSLMEASAQIIWICNADGEMAIEQPTWSAFTGQTFDDYNGWGWLDTIHSDDRSYIGNAWLTAVANRSLYEVEFRMRRHDGEYRDMSCRGVPILNGDGSIREWIGANTDITERKQAEEALRQQQAVLRDRNVLLSSILESTPDIIVVKDREGRYVALNSFVAKSFYGRPIEEIIGKDDSELLPPAAAIAIMAKDRQIMEAGITESYEEDVFNGKENTSFLTTKAPWRDAQGNILGLIAIARNINDRKQAEAQLRDRNALLNSILESTPDIIVVKDTEGRYVALNSNVANFLGKPIEEIIGKDDLELMSPDTAREIMAKDRQVMAAGITETYEEDVSDVEKTATFFTTKAPWRDGNGNILGIIATTRDISDRKKVEQTLRQTLEILDLASDGIIIRDMDDRIIYWNQGAEKLYGWTKAEVAGEYIHTFLETVFPQPLETIMAEFFQQGSWEGELHHTTRDGGHIIVASRWTLQRDGEGKPCAQLEINNDISDRKLAEDAIKQSEERYRSLILATSQIVWTADSEGRCSDIPSLRAYTGQTEAEALGFGWLDTIHPDDSERTAQAWMEAVQTKNLYDIEYRIRAADGNYRYFQGRAVPILNEDGSLREWVGTCIDIHDRKQTEIVQAKAREAAEAASRAKSEFLANMSHELRTPLNGIMGYAQILQRSKVLNEEERSRIDVIYQCGSHLLTLINDILDLSKIEAQKVELMPTDFHFPAFLQGVAEMCRIRAELKGIHFHFPSSPELPIGIRADEKRLRQVLINLLSNAIKFTDEGSVTFTVSFAAEGKIRFEIRDTGTGIAQDQLQAIFQPFEQVGDRRRQTEGTGLGLAISKRIVELMGSTIQVQSEMNVGSIFWFDVNLSQADEWVKTSQIDHRGQIIGIKDRQPKIVVIDDKWANRSVISNLLSPIGFEVFEANDGQEGWEKILEVHPDLIVTDLLMPQLDGFELIKRVRESESFKETIIIVSSASVFETDQYRSLEAGGNTFIPKPIQATELLQKLQQYLDLEWVYEANEDPLARSSDTNELIAPPATEMEMLYELAMKGNFREIVKQAALLEEIDPKYIPFAKILHQMAKDFQDEEILTFIQSYK